MEYRDNYYNKMPFYMAYPMQNLYLMEMEYEKDMERMKELYPKEVRQLQQMVERRCDQMEYDGSRIYDENPDRFMLEEEVRRILEQFLRENPQYRDMGGNMSPRPIMPRPEEMEGMPPRPIMPRPDEMGGMPPRPIMPRPDEMGGMPPRPIMPRPEEMGGMPPRPIMPRPDEMGGMPPYPIMPRADELEAQHRRDEEVPWLRSLIGILFHDEIYRRRCRHRRCQRWW